MKNILIIGILLSICQATHSQENYIIEGKIRGLEDGVIINLRRSEGRLMVVIKSDTVRNESFHFKVPAENSLPEQLMINSYSKGFPNTWFNIWVAPGKEVHISGDNKLIRTWKVKSDIKEQQELNKYNEATHILWAEFLKQDIKGNELYDILNNPHSKDEDKQAAKEQIKSAQAKGDSIYLLIFQKEVEVMKQNNSDNVVWLDKLNGLSYGCRFKKDYPFRKDAMELYKRLTPEQKKSELGKEITVNIFPPQAVKEGDAMADYELYDLQGKLHRLSDFKGKAILLDFWSRGCGPCIMSIPEMKELSEEYKDKINFISISQDNKKHWSEASKTYNITWNNLNDMQGCNGISAKYDIRGIPSYVFISPEGKIIQTWMGYAKGNLKVNINRCLEIQNYPATTVERQNENIIINAPTIAQSNNSILLIKKVELTDTATIVHFKAFHTPNNWIKIESKIYLKSEKGIKYSLVKTDGIPLDQEYFMPESGQAEFKMIFAPMPKDTKKFDFIEGDAPGDWQINGVSLTEKDSKN